MFEPDIFSVAKPTFTLVLDEVANHVSKVIESHYSSLGKLEKGVYQSGAVELNSNNFLISIDCKRYILKKGTFTDSQSRIVINEQVILANWLSEQGCKTPQIVLNDSQSFFAQDGNTYWYLMFYTDGDYFTGEGDEFLNAGHSLVELLLALKRLPDHVSLTQKITPPSKSDINLLQQIELAEDNWINIFGEELLAVLKENWECIKSTLSEIILIEENMLDSISPCHFDLHPHNLLMKNHEVVAVVDFGSFVSAPLGSSIAFNLFKLARQTIVAKNGNYKNNEYIKHREQVINELKSKELLPESLHMSLLAKVEIMRRLLLILRLNFIDRNRDWNHVLPIQINALKEVDLVYA